MEDNLNIFFNGRLPQWKTTLICFNIEDDLKTTSILFEIGTLPQTSMGK